MNKISRYLSKALVWGLVLLAWDISVMAQDEAGSVSDEWGRPASILPADYYNFDLTEAVAPVPIPNLEKIAARSVVASALEAKENEMPAPAKVSGPPKAPGPPKAGAGGNPRPH